MSTEKKTEAPQASPQKKKELPQWLMSKSQRAKLAEQTIPESPPSPPAPPPSSVRMESTRDIRHGGVHYLPGDAVSVKPDDVAAYAKEGFKASL